MRILAMSDLHLSKKPWQVRKALRMGSDADLVLLAGDLVNDGTPEQWACMHTCIAEVLPDTPVLAVAGNHDYPRYPSPLIRREICDYQSLAEWLLGRQSYPATVDSSGAWAIHCGEAEILGLNCVTHWRKFLFPQEAQLRWLETRLNEQRAPWRIILCHAPLLAHNPQRTDRPYLHRDKQLQGILNVHRNVIFLSGHTHVSMESAISCVEYEEDRNHIYINDGSIRPTTLLQQDGRPAKSPADGNVVELLLEGNQLTLTAYSTKTAQPLLGIQYCFFRQTECYEHLP